MTKAGSTNGVEIGITPRKLSEDELLALPKLNRREKLAIISINKRKKPTKKKPAA